MAGMPNITEALVNFTTETRFEDLPGDVIHETKRVLLDSVGCALGGLSIDKGKIAVQAAKQLAGSPNDASILGTGERVSYFGAAFANGELIQALDYDPIIFPAIHITPFVLAAPLALAEGLHRSGKELVRAAAIALEMSARFGKAFPKKGQVVDGTVVPPPVRGYSWTIFGGTAASGILLGLNAERMAHALGIAGVIAPVSARQKFMTTIPIHMSKHLMAGWICGAEITAVHLSHMGYGGDTQVFDGDYGFWRFSGYPHWEPAAITDDLGESWQFVSGTHYKLYPCCGVFRTALDCSTHLITEKEIEPNEIEKINVFLDLETFGVQSVWENPRIEGAIDAQFSAAYNVAVAAHRLRPMDWQTPETLRNPAILGLMKKIIVAPHPDFPKHEATKGDRGKVEIYARGEVFTEERVAPKGSPGPEALRMTDDELAGKFRDQASMVLPAEKTDSALNKLLTLETQKDMFEVVKELTQTE